VRFSPPRLFSSQDEKDKRKTHKRFLTFILLSSPVDFTFTTMTDSIDTETPVYLKSAAHGWIPAVQLKQVAGGKMARVAVPKFKHENDVLTCGKMTKAQLMDTIDIPFADYDNNVLPVQNVDANGNLEDYKDMVELPFMHEVRHERE
jgi:hypothetical protein